MEVIKISNKVDVLIPGDTAENIINSINFDRVIASYERQKRQNRRNRKPNIFKGLKGIMQPIMISIQ